MRLETDPQNKTIQMRGPIGDFEGGISADDFRDCLKEHAGSDLTIHLDSEGGVVSEGLAMYNAIMQHDGEVTIHIDTIAASIATVIACAADRVVINSNAKFMVHRCWTMAMGNCKDFRSTADIMEMMDKDIAATYVERTGKDEADVIAMMDAETWMMLTRLWHRALSTRSIESSVRQRQSLLPTRSRLTAHLLSQPRQKQLPDE